MTTEFDALTNRGEYLAAHYFADRLTDDLTKHLLSTWSLRENDDLHLAPTPRQAVRALRRTYLDAEVRPFFAAAAQRDEDARVEGLPSLETYGAPAWEKQLREWHDCVLEALSIINPGPKRSTLTVYRSGRAHEVAVAAHGDGIVALDCGWAPVADAVFTPEGPGRLLAPLRVSSTESYETGPALASWLFGAALDEPGGSSPRFVLLLCGGVIVLADRRTWSEGRFLAASLDLALERADRRQTGELAILSALFCRDLLAPRNSGSPLMDELLKASADNAVGVDQNLRHGLQRSVEILANEVLARLAEAGVSPREIEQPGRSIARELTRESLRYLYRVLFLLFAEARPELGVLPADDGSYEAGYSVARLRELVDRDEQLVDPAARTGFHLHASLERLFALVNDGHRRQGTEPDDDLPGDDDATRRAKAQRRSEDRGLRFEALRSTLFEPDALRLVGRRAVNPRDDEAPALDLRLRNAALHEVLRLLTRRAATRRGERGGFVSYRNLGINQLGAVYEGLMSYTGILADEELCEVAKDGDPEQGSWLIPARRQDEYPEDTLVRYDEHDRLHGLRGPKRYPEGSFVYRLAGRDRETSASYYTPQSLTSGTVELTLKHRLDQPVPVRASELLQFTICEPALGSGAFLNEAIDQVAEEYLRRRQVERGESIPPADAITEKQRVKAYIALHNAYGVDLNATGVELAEVSLWLNTMHPGMQAPWFGLHLRRGNSLVGARRAVYTRREVLAKDKAWLKAKGGLAPTPLAPPERLPDDAVHQFLLPSPGWGAVAGSKEVPALGQKPAADAIRAWKRGLLTAPSAKQYDRLAGAGRRVEFLWRLVAKRMEISEEAIARRIPVWGADPAEDEFAFLGRGGGAVPKEQVLTDLFHAHGSPYWRLKQVMDAWCALWFWPLGHAGELDGSSAAYAVDAAPAIPKPTPPPGPTPTPARTESQFLFPLAGEQLGFDEAPERTVEVTTRARPSRGRTHSVREARRPVIPLANLDDWLDFLESLLGTADVSRQPGLIDQLDSLDELRRYENELPDWMGMDAGDVEARFPWMHRVGEIAAEQGVLHWELEFARVFSARGGFDLQVGNPPWVRPDWDEDSVLAEHEPWFKLKKDPPQAEKARQRENVLAAPAALHFTLRELCRVEAQAETLSSAQLYPILSGTRPDLYRAFMCKTWQNANRLGCIGLLHPDTHFSGERDGVLREHAYSRLRVHADFVNAGNRFFPPPIGRSSHFGLHVYGPQQEINFISLSWLFTVASLMQSLYARDPLEGPQPGVRYEGDWDERPHPTRVIHVDMQTLGRWRKITDEIEGRIEQTRLLTPISSAEDSAISTLGGFPLRVSALSPKISTGLNETNGKKPNWGPNKDVALFEKAREFSATSWHDVILKGPQIGVANCMFKQPSQGKGEVRGLDLRVIEADSFPESEYRRVAPKSIFHDALESWTDSKLGKQDCETSAQRASSNFYRVAWRRQIAPDTERALYAAIIPPGPSHVHLIHSLTVDDPTALALIAGFWASLPLDYLVRISGRGDLQVRGANLLPAPCLEHPLAPALTQRSLRLNCLTTAHSELWKTAFDETWPHEDWALEWPGSGSLSQVSLNWTADSALRSEYARRAALVEIDALVAVWLGISAETLVTMYRARFPIMQSFDEVTWFDSSGCKIAGDRYTYGHGQTKDHWKQFQAYLADPQKTSVPKGYSPPFYKADREEEMTAAHAVFQARVDAAVARGEWDPVKGEVPQ